MKHLIVALFVISSGAHAAEGKPCDKYEKLASDICGETSSEKCRAKDNQSRTLVVKNLKELMVPRAEVEAAQKTFAAKEKVNMPDVQSYFESMASLCPQAQLKLFRIAMNSVPRDQVTPLLKEIANRSFESYPILLSASVDVVIIDNAQAKGILKLTPEGKMDLQALRAEIKKSRAKVQMKPEGSHVEADPMLAKKVSKIETVETAKLRAQLQTWAGKYLAVH